MLLYQEWLYMYKWLRQTVSILVIICYSQLYSFKKCNHVI